MPKITIDKKHRYHVEGIKDSMPSTSTIAKLVSGDIGDGLLIWASRLALKYDDEFGFRRDDSAEVGTFSHAEIHSYIQTGEKPVDASSVFWGWYAALNETVSDWIASEHMLYHPTKLYGGTVDAIGVQDGKVTLFDWKTRDQKFSDGEIWHFDKKGKAHRKDPRKLKDVAQLGGYYSALLKDESVPTPTVGKITYIYRDTGVVEFDEVNLWSAKILFEASYNLYKTIHIKGGYYSGKPTED